MARPATKSDLVQIANEQFKKIWLCLDGMTIEEQNAFFNFGTSFVQKEAHWKRDKNLRDVFIHLYEWHQLLLSWVSSNQKGQVQPFIPAPYNWKTYGQMNVIFWEKHQRTSLADGINKLKASHSQVMEMINGFSNEELFTKGIFSWISGATLGSYCVSATASHYDWAIKKMKAHKKTYNSL